MYYRIRIVISDFIFSYTLPTRKDNILLLKKKLLHYIVLILDEGDI